MIGLIIWRVLQIIMQVRPDKIDPDTLTFTQMLARERQTDNEKFTWRSEHING